MDKKEKVRKLEKIPMIDSFTYNLAYMARFDSEGHETYLNNSFLPSLEYLLGAKAEEKLAIEVDDDLTEVVVFFIHDCQLKQLVELLDSEKLVVEHSDISRDLLFGNDVLAIVDKMMNSDEFSSKFESFKTHNISIDVILDKINSLGFDSLTNTDIQILENR